MDNSKEISFVGSTKSDIYKAYKDLKEQLNKKDSIKPVSTTEIARKENVKKSVTNTQTLDVNRLNKNVTSFVETLTSLKTTFDEVETAIKAKKAELKDIHDIEVSANDLAALYATKEALLDDKKREAKEIIENANAKADETISTAKHDAKIIRENLSNEIEEIKKQRAREEEEYNYTTERNRRLDNDKAEEDLNKKRNSLNDRERNIKEREEDLALKDTEIKELKEKIEQIGEESKKEISASFHKGHDKAEKAAKQAAELAKAEFSADIRIKDAEIKSLKEKVTELSAQLDRANTIISDANNKVASMANNALAVKSAADANTLNQVQKTLELTNKNDKK